jgi:2-C-methyl-D-erythritol 4-phosphate cytidylyltransferase/2-C-methyl-D-erythritol 2,4-cyclodiphosphate synthase
VERAALIVLAAGSGSRLGLDVPKAFAPLAGRTILEHALAAAFDPAWVDALVVAVPAGWEERAGTIMGPSYPRAVVTGGPSRQASVRAALAAVPADAETIVVHDAARPLTHPAFFLAVLKMLEGWDGVVPVTPVTDTVKRLDGERVVGTESRAALVLAQTPQAFRGGALRDAHARAERAGDAVTDDAEAVELAGYRVRAIGVDAANFKITTPEDLARAESVLAAVAHG